MRMPNKNLENRNARAAGHFLVEEARPALGEQAVHAERGHGGREAGRRVPQRF